MDLRCHLARFDVLDTSLLRPSSWGYFVKFQEITKVMKTLAINKSDIKHFGMLKHNQRNFNTKYEHCRVYFVQITHSVQAHARSFLIPCVRSFLIPCVRSSLIPCVRSFLIPCVRSFKCFYIHLHALSCRQSCVVSGVRSIFVRTFLSSFALPLYISILFGQFTDGFINFTNLSRPSSFQTFHPPVVLYK